MPLVDPRALVSSATGAVNAGLRTPPPTGPGPATPTDNSNLYALNNMDLGLRQNGTGTARGAGEYAGLQGQGFAYERQHLTPTAAPQANAAQVNTGLISPDRKQQQGAVGLIQGAATGQAPSAAELMLRDQANRSAAQQFGAAAALQGRSPGGALSSALEGAQRAQSDAAQQAGILRAQEQATARGQLVDATGALRSADQNLATTNAGLQQQTNLANQGSTLAGLQLDANQRNALLNAQLTSTGQYIQGITGQGQIDQQNKAANDAFAGSLISTGASLAPVLLAASDERVKTDVKRVDLDRLADALEGFGFKYKDPKYGEGQRVGVMAQDVKRGGPIGRSLVVEEKGEPMKLDVGNSMGAALAMAAEALKRSRKAA